MISRLVEEVAELVSPMESREDSRFWSGGCFLLDMFAGVQVERGSGSIELAKIWKESSKVVRQVNESQRILPTSFVEGLAEICLGIV